MNSLQKKKIEKTRRSTIYHFYKYFSKFINIERIYMSYKIHIYSLYKPVFIIGFSFFFVVFNQLPACIINYYL